MSIHPSAVIDSRVQLDEGVEVGPYAVIEGDVRIGRDTRIGPHAYITGWTTIGQRCQVYPFASIGAAPQDFHFGGERSYCHIGNDVIIREGATIHRGTQPESGTVIGDECFLMATSHIGHNVRLGRAVKIYNYVAVSGHVEIDDQAILSGAALIHQFTRIGRLAFIAGGARVTMDVPPFMMVHGESTIVQHNRVGMRRAGYTPEELLDIRQAFHTLYRSPLTFPRALEQLRNRVTTRAGRELLAFCEIDSKRGYCGGVRRRSRQACASEADAPN